MDENKTYFTFLIGDFNAKIGKYQTGETSMGMHGVGTRNERGHTLVNFLETRQLKIMNTFFLKKEHQKWTWKSPNEITKNEIDFIISDRKNTIQDVSVLNLINISDHRMVRARVEISIRSERRKLIEGRARNINHIEARNKEDNYKNVLEKAFSDNPIRETINVEELHNYTIHNIKEAANSVLKKVNTSKRQTKLKEETIKLIDRRNKKKVNMSAEEIKETNKEIRRRVRLDISEYNETTIRETIERNKWPKVFRRKIQEGCIIYTMVIL